MKPPDWNRLWNRLSDVYTTSGATRQKSVLANHKNNKETILRKLGVVCEADIVRISDQLNKNK